MAGRVVEVLYRQSGRVLAMWGDVGLSRGIVVSLGHVFLYHIRLRYRLGDSCECVTELHLVWPSNILLIAIYIILRDVTALQFTEVHSMDDTALKPSLDGGKFGTTGREDVV
jgi:hypothetical protein